MTAVPVPASQVHSWLLEIIASSLEHVSAKESGSLSCSDKDVVMADASPSSAKASQSARSPNFIELHIRFCLFASVAPPIIFKGKLGKIRSVRVLELINFSSILGGFEY